MPASLLLPEEACTLCAGVHVQPAAGAAGFFHCRVCDVRFLHSSLRLTAAEEESRYRAHNNDPADLGYRAFLQPLVSALAPHLPRESNGLDFGCGPGPLLSMMWCELGFKMDTYDPIFQPQEPSHETRFDFVTLSEVAEHLFTPLAEFRRLHSWLRPGGWLGVMTALTDPPVDFASWYYRRDPTHVVFYSRRSFEWLAHALKFNPPRFHSERVILLQRPV